VRAVDSLGDWRRRTVVAYLDEPPFFAPSLTGRPTGCDVELAEFVLAGLGVDDVEWVLVTFDELIPGVRTGRWHLNSPMFVTDDRAALVRFTVPVWAVIDGFIVRREDRRDLSSYEAIAADESIVLGVVTGQVQRDSALSIGVPAGRIVEFVDQDAAARAVRDGTIDASASTAPGSFAFVARAADASLVAVADQRAAARGTVPVGAFSAHPDSTDLVTAVDGQLRRHLGSAGHMAMMARYGFTAESLAPVIAPRERNKQEGD
jgi:polar amino acid transport system substrate-binding protein